MIEEKEDFEEDKLDFKPAPPAGMRYVGKWQIIVIWYELPAEGRNLVLCEGIYKSEKEMEEAIKPLVEDGTIYDIVGTIESTWVSLEAI
jgi:hypothetical protein